MRLFYAIPLPEEILSGIARLQRCVPVGTSVKWVRPSAYHLTLRFLGEAGQDLLCPLCRLIEEVSRDVAPFEVELSFLGAFPKISRATALWVGVSEGGEALAGLAARVEARVEGLGFEAERRPFAGHLTLGRLRQPGPVPGWEGRVGPFRFVAKEAVLFQSVLSPGGALYERVNTAPFVRSREGGLPTASKEE